MHRVLVALSVVLVSRVSGFNPPAVVPVHRAPNVQPQNAPNRVVPAAGSSEFSFLPPTPSFDPALSATSAGVGFVSTAAQTVRATEPMAAQESWQPAVGQPGLHARPREDKVAMQTGFGSLYLFAAGIFGAVLGSLGVLGARRWGLSTASPQRGAVGLNQNLFSMAGSDLAPYPPGNVHHPQAVYAASPELSGALQGPLMAHYNEQDKVSRAGFLAGLASAAMVAGVHVAPVDASINSQMSMNNDSFSVLSDNQKVYKSTGMTENPYLSEAEKMKALERQARLEDCANLRSESACILEEDNREKAQSGTKKRPSNPLVTVGAPVVVTTAVSFGLLKFIGANK